MLTKDGSNELHNLNAQQASGYKDTYVIRTVKGTRIIAELGDTSGALLLLTSIRAPPPNKKFKIDYGYRAAHGITQIADWFEQVSNRQNSKMLEERFDSWSIRFRGLMLVGLDRHIAAADLRMCKERLSALSANLLIHGQPVQIMTYDDFCAALLRRLKIEHDLP